MNFFSKRLRVFLEHKTLQSRREYRLGTKEYMQPITVVSIRRESLKYGRAPQVERSRFSGKLLAVTSSAPVRLKSYLSPRVISAVWTAYRSTGCHPLRQSGPLQRLGRKRDPRDCLGQEGLRPVSNELPRDDSTDRWRLSSGHHLVVGSRVTRKESVRSTTIDSCAFGHCTFCSTFSAMSEM